jgi:hypothetical protein
MRRKSRTPRTDNIDQTAPASVVMNKFGGLARFCELSKQYATPERAAIPTSTVWGWITRGDIPPKRVPEVKAIAALARPIVRLKDADFVRKAA